MSNQSELRDLSELDQLVEAITVDAHDLEEQITAFHAVFTDEMAAPIWATMVGVSVLVVDVDIRDNGLEMTAHCRHEGDEQEISFTDVVFPPETIAARIHAAYRRLQGLEPFPSSIVSGWRPDWL